QSLCELIPHPSSLPACTWISGVFLQAYRTPAQPDRAGRCYKLRRRCQSAWEGAIQNGSRGGGAADSYPGESGLIQKAPSALLMAHPGHELFLHHWLETERPIVFVLSDGSGGRGEDRRAASARIIQATGASIGPVFGLAPDQRWYAAILAGEGDLFDQARQLILTACRAARVRRIVTDPVQLYNPLHDLCNALATGIARILAREEGSEIELLDYAIEHPDLKSGRARLELPVTGDAYSRKRQAVASYLQLAAEVERRDWSGA